MSVNSKAPGLPLRYSESMPFVFIKYISKLLIGELTPIKTISSNSTKIKEMRYSFLNLFLNENALITNNSKIIDKYMLILYIILFKYKFPGRLKYGESKCTYSIILKKFAKSLYSFISWWVP